MPTRPTRSAAATSRTGQVKGVDLAADAVTSGKVRNGTLLARDFKAGELPPGAAGKDGAAGAGRDGAPGAPGAPGANGVPGPGGPSGPSASSSGEESFAFPLNFSSSAALGVAITDITLTARSRIAVTAATTFSAIQNGDPSFQATCRIELSTTQLTDIETISATRSITAPSGTGGIDQASLALTGLGVRDPGAYRVIVRCYSNSINRARQRGASVLAVATADAG